MDWIIFLHIFTIVNKCLLFPLFWFKKNNSLANKLLAILILLPAIPVVCNFLIYSNQISHYPDILYLYQIFINLFGPVFYFYCMEMSGQPFSFTRKKVLHLLPCVFPMIFWIDFHMLPKDQEELFVQTFLDPEKLTWKMEVISVTPALFALPYIVIATLKVHKYANAAKNVFTNIEALKMGYIKEFVNLTLIEILILLLLNFVIPAKHIEIIWVPILGNILYFYIVYKSYNYSVIFSEQDYRKYQQLFLPLQEFTEEATQKYSHSVLTNTRADEYARVLGEGFELQGWHLDPELNLKTLSEKTGIPVHYISQTINQRFEKNFFDYVNYYRVEDLKLKLLDPALAHIRIEELSYMSGFNSKAAFQRAFKKHAGMSPTDYRSLKTQDALQTVN